MLRSSSCLLVAGLALCLSACGEENAIQGTPPPPPQATGAVAAAAKTPATQSEIPNRTFRDSDFSESESNRDPFRNYATELRQKAPVVAQRLVLMPDTPVDNMKLIAIITGIEQPCAMIVDQRGVGYVTTRGDFVGKADVVSGGGSESLPVALNWRIDRIRGNEVVLAREDPSAPNRPPLTRVIPLHDEEPALGLAAKING